MDLITSNIGNGDGEIPSSNPIYTDFDQKRQTSDHGSVFDSEDDLSLGADAQGFSTSSPPHFSPESSSISTGFLYESSVESSGDRDPGSERVIKKLVHVGRHISSDSLLSNVSDFSRTSNDVSSLLNAMTVDPEEFLADLGFGEPDMRSRIPDRFLDSPSKARGIDVDTFRQSLDQDDVYGSPSLDSPGWSDPGSSRIPLRFITSPEPVNPVFSENCHSVPLISEPEEAPEDSFDLMRHLRLNKPTHSSKGMFLEPVTEELEVSSVGSGTVRTKISRKLSNEGTIVREESWEQPIAESEVLLSVPVVEKVEKGADSVDMDEKEVVVQFGNDSQIVINVESDEGVCVSIGEDFSTGDSTKLSSGAVNDNDSAREDTSITDHNENFISEDLLTKMDEDVKEFPPELQSPAHLRVASVVVQDSFELEEITNDDCNEKGCSRDPEPGLNVKSLRNCLTRENSGESSGFEEMPPDKESLTPNSSPPTLMSKRLSGDARVIVSDARRPLTALLDPGILNLTSEKTQEGKQNLDENSPRASFAQRRTRSLTKQRPIDGEALAAWCYSPQSFAPIDPADDEGRFRMKASHDTFTVESEPRFLERFTKEPAVVFSASSSNTWVGKTDVNYHSTPTLGEEKVLLNAPDNSLNNTDLTSVEHVRSELQDNIDIANTEAELRSSSETNEAVRDEERVSLLTATTNVTLEHNFAADEKEKYKNMDNYSPARDSVNDTREDTRLSRDLVGGKMEPLTLTGAFGACVEVNHKEDSEKALREVDSEYQQHYLHEINVLEQSIQKYETALSSGGPLDELGASYSTKHMLARITEEMNAIQELRLMISSELKRMKHLLIERRDMLLAGVSSDSLGSEVSQKMADLLIEQSSLNTGLSKIGDELSIRRKASRRARIHFHIENAKKELKEERERCLQEFREEIKEALVRELSERFSSEIEFLRSEVRSKDALIEQLKKNQHREPREKELYCLELREGGQSGIVEDMEPDEKKAMPGRIEELDVNDKNSEAGNVKDLAADEGDSQVGDRKTLEKQKS